MVMDLVVLAPGLVFTQLVQFMSPDLLRVLASVVLMQSQGILVLAMVMAMVLVVSVQVLDCILLEQFMSPGLPKVSVADTCTKLCVLVLCNIFLLFFRKKKKKKKIPLFVPPFKKKKKKKKKKKS